jgi:hypothetical protein
LKIESDLQEEVNIEKLVRNEDFNPVSQKINNIIKKARKIIKRQVSEIQNEDSSYNLQQNYSKTFITFTIIQIVVVLAIGFYHIYSFKTFLISNKIINA